MKKTLKIIILVLTVLTACSPKPMNNITSIQNSTNNKDLKTSISGKVKFPNYVTQNSFFSPTRSEVSIAYPYTHEISPNKIILTGEIDESGNFVIPIEKSFNPKIGEVFILYADKIFLEHNNSRKTVKTYIQWNGKSWNSINKSGITINLKTTVLSTMVELIGKELNLANTIGKIDISESFSNVFDIKKEDKVIIHASSIMLIENIKKKNLEANYNLLNYLVYKNGTFFIIDTKNATNFAGNTITNSYINIDLNKPTALAFDNSDNMYIADTGNNRIIKINKNTKIISNIAGTWEKGFNGDNINATNANLNNPQGLGVDSMGNVYIADTDNNRVRKVDKNTNIISTIHEMYFPNGIGFDQDGNVYISNF